MLLQNGLNQAYANNPDVSFDGLRSQAMQSSISVKSPVVREMILEALPDVRQRQAPTPISPSPSPTPVLDNARPGQAPASPSPGPGAIGLARNDSMIWSRGQDLPETAWAQSGIPQPVEDNLIANLDTNLTELRDGTSGNRQQLLNGIMAMVKEENPGLDLHGLVRAFVRTNRSKLEGIHMLLPEELEAAARNRG